MRTLIAISLVLLLTAGHAQDPGDMLKKAYKKNSSEMLMEFFQDWSHEIHPISENELAGLNDTIQQTYQVFTAFYRPQSIDSLGGSEWGNDIYKDVKFLVIQNFIRIYFTDKLYWSDQERDDYIVDYINKNITNDSVRQMLLKRSEGKLSKFVIENFSPEGTSYYDQKDTLIDSIVDFRPAINCNGKPPLYLTSKYSNILNSFLGDKYQPLGKGSIMNPARAKGQSADRKKFLEPEIVIWYGHWGGYWQLYSYPAASSITFDKEMQYAKVNFRMVYEGGEALLKNVDGKWVLISTKRTWIE